MKKKRGDLPPQGEAERERAIDTTDTEKETARLDEHPSIPEGQGLGRTCITVVPSYPHPTIGQHIWLERPDLWKPNYLNSALERDIGDVSLVSKCMASSQTNLSASPSSATY